MKKPKTQMDQIPVKSAAVEINRLHREIIAAARQTLDNAILIGELLSREHERLQHGEWLPWVTSNLTFTERTARNYIRCFENRLRLKSENVVPRRFQWKVG